MNRFKRIAHRGWLGRALSILTFGYYPYTESAPDVGAVDWCVSATVLQDWTTGATTLQNWTAAASPVQSWMAAASPAQDWQTSAATVCTWQYHIEVTSCEL